MDRFKPAKNLPPVYGEPTQVVYVVTAATAFHTDQECEVVQRGIRKGGPRPSKLHAQVAAERHSCRLCCPGLTVRPEVLRLV